MARTVIFVNGKLDILLNLTTCITFKSNTSVLRLSET